MICFFGVRCPYGAPLRPNILISLKSLKIQLSQRLTGITRRYHIEPFFAGVRRGQEAVSAWPDTQATGL